MNNDRRKEIASIIDDLNALRDRISNVFEEEDEYKEGIPENLQGSERYEKAETACDNLDNAVNGVDEIIEYLEQASE